MTPYPSIDLVGLRPGSDSTTRRFSPHLTTTQPKPVEALGIKGVSIDHARKVGPTPALQELRQARGSKCVVLFVGGIAPVVYDETTLSRWYVLQQPDGKQLVVEQFVEPATAFKREQPAFDACLGRRARRASRRPAAARRRCA